jgi:hypothetical protein
LGNVGLCVREVYNEILGEMKKILGVGFEGKGYCDEE